MTATNTCRRILRQSLLLECQEESEKPDDPKAPEFKKQLDRTGLPDVVVIGQRIQTEEGKIAALTCRLVSGPSESLTLDLD